MLKGLSTAGIGKVSGLKEHIHLASINGFHAVETTIHELREFVETQGLRQAQEYLKEKNVIIGALQLPVEWRMDDARFKEGLKELVETAELASKFDCKTFFTYFMPSTDREIAPYLLELSKRIQLMGRLIREYDMNLALEYVGPHHLRHKWKNVFIYDAKTTLQWLDLVGESNVGIVLDSFHWYTSQESIEDILAIETSRIKYVHLNDARPIPVEDVLDNDRVFPGEGAIDLEGFLKALDEINYTGLVTQEILTIEELEESCEELAKKSGEAFSNVFNKVFTSLVENN
ncbi:sugar phosphate isomerase/epimerase family protein [Fredinandcohnia onubensis]|uniref:sugar phosphate isomerase/epimerase family protein n=1 Tax=Fredinandcohnia onubensis TaxID=1571209 RepID=UPI000C0BC6D9|nr:sugar phosphate isomerase/epimerase family protein [Fredinandcohnia onubensis]